MFDVLILKCMQNLEYKDKIKHYAAFLFSNILHVSIVSIGAVGA